MYLVSGIVKVKWETASYLTPIIKKHQPKISWKILYLTLFFTKRFSTICREMNFNDLQFALTKEKITHQLSFLFFPTLTKVNDFVTFFKTLFLDKTIKQNEMAQLPTVLRSVWF